jgi:hypothetical protein
MDFDDLVTITRVPLADMVQKAIAANGDQAAIDAVILATAEGMAEAYWNGISNAVDTGKAIESFNRLKVCGVPQ